MEIGGCSKKPIESNEQDLITQSERAKRKLMSSRAIDSILKNMVKLVNQCNIQGFVYGIITEDGKSVSSASENLRYWWKEKVNFDRNGPAAIMKYKLYGSDKDMLNGDHNYGSLRKLHDLPDTTLGPLLSCLIHKIDPPAKRLNLEDEVPPPWWPKGDEEWWSQLDFKNDMGPPPYRKIIHCLKKAWKVAVLVSIIKNISITKIKDILHQSNLQDKMSVKDAAILSAILNHEEFLVKEKNHTHELPPQPQGSIINHELPDMFHETHDYDVEDIIDGGIGSSSSSINVQGQNVPNLFDANVKGKDKVSYYNNLPQSFNMVFDANVDASNMVVNNNLAHQSMDLVPSIANLQGINMAHQSMDLIPSMANLQGINMAHQSMDLIPSIANLQGINMAHQYPNNLVPSMANLQGINMAHQYPNNLVPIDEYDPRNDKVIRPNPTKRARFRYNGNYTCDCPICPYHYQQAGFHSKELRDYHQVNCAYRSKSFYDQGNIIGGSSNQGNMYNIGSSSSGFKPFVKPNK